VALAFPAVTIFCIGNAAADTDTAGLLAPLKVFASAFNQADRTFPTKAYTDDATTIDEFSPYSWRGPKAARIWYAATTGGNTDADYQQFRASHQVLTLDKPLTVRQSGKHAFVVIATKLTFQAKGTTHLQHLDWTVSEIETAYGWRIAAQAWALIDDVPVK